MNSILKGLLVALLLSSFPLAAAERTSIPLQPIANKKELLFADDFKGETRDKRWHRVVETFTFESGALKGTQTREATIPAANGKPEIKAHAAVFGLEAI